MNPMGMYTAISTTVMATDRPAELAGTPESGFLERDALFQVAVHVFHHDDRIVHHEADGEHQCQERHEVDGVTQDEHDEECTDQR